MVYNLKEIQRKIETIREHYSEEEIQKELAKHKDFLTALECLYDNVSEENYSEIHLQEYMQETWTNNL